MITSSYNHALDKLTINFPAGMTSVICIEVVEFSYWGRFRLLDIKLPNVSPYALVIATLDESSLIYISRHIIRLESKGSSKASMTDSKWRIASNIDLFPDLSIDGSLTPQQEGVIDNLIKEFVRLYNPSVLVEKDYIAAP
jgi:hypothetical protein